MIVIYFSLFDSYYDSIFLYIIGYFLTDRPKYCSKTPIIKSVT